MKTNDYDQKCVDFGDPTGIMCGEELVNYCKLNQYLAGEDQNQCDRLK